METFKILARVYPSEPGFTAVVTALPEKTSTLAQVRTRCCDSHNEAVTLLQPMTHTLRLELMDHGHSVVAIEFPAPSAPEFQAWV
jgi:hypothetical protein